jgi:hypothetical protein
MKINEIDVDKLYDLLINNNISIEVALCFKSKFSFVFKILLNKNVFFKRLQVKDCICLQKINRGFTL